MLFNNSKENTDILLERLREDIYEKGFRAIEKKHVKLIMDSEEPDFMASLVINGWEEPRRHYANPILSERQFNKLLALNRGNERFKRDLLIGTTLAKFEAQLDAVQYRYKTSILTVVSFLKDYIERENTRSIFSAVKHILGKENSQKLKDLLDEYNESATKSKNIVFNDDNVYKLKAYDGDFIIANKKKYINEWNKLCHSVEDISMTYKTYLLSIKGWILDYDAMLFAPTDIIRQIDNPVVTFDFVNIPKEYTYGYRGELKENGINESEDSFRLAAFRQYSNVSILNDTDEYVRKLLTNMVKKEEESL